MWTNRHIRDRFSLFTTAGSLLAILFGTLPAGAFETDNYSLPSEPELADIGAFLEAAHTLVLQRAVEEVNARIEKALLIKAGPARVARLQRLQSPQALFEVLASSFGYPLFEDHKLESALRGKQARQAEPHRILSHQDLRMSASSYLPLDLRWLSIVAQSRTVKAFGVYFGTDKIVHFHRLGASYYRMNLDLLKKGLGKEEAYRKVIAHYTSRAFISERALFGSALTGVFSNADLAANQAGFKFFLNLTERVRLKGEERDPLVVRCGAFWRVNRHVRFRSGWFGAFVSDHWNEALNPSEYDASRRPGVRRFLRNNAERIVRYYSERDGRPDDAAYYDSLARELSTYYGEPYGHSGNLEHLLTIGNTCIPALRGFAVNGVDRMISTSDGDRAKGD